MILKLEQQLKLYVEKNEEKIAEYEKSGSNKNQKLLEVRKKLFSQRKKKF